MIGPERSAGADHHETQLGGRAGAERQRGGGPTSEEDPIVTLARRLLPRLDELLGDAAPDVRTELNRLLEATASPDPDTRTAAEDGLYVLIARHDATRERMRELPSIDEQRTAFEGTYSAAGPMSYDSYRCPACDYTWPILSVDDPVAPPTACPVHPDRALIFHAAER